MATDGGCQSVERAANEKTGAPRLENPRTDDRNAFAREKTGCCTSIDGRIARRLRGR